MRRISEIAERQRKQQNLDRNKSKGKLLKKVGIFFFSFLENSFCALCFCHSDCGLFG